VAPKHLAHGPLAELADDLVLADAFGRRHPGIADAARAFSRSGGGGRAG
jgi:hypothetical protein